jgi:hypothetical protein
LLQIPPAGAGLGVRFDVFLKEANDVMYKHYPTESALDRALGVLIREYERFHKAADLFREIYNHREKLCITYVRKMFTNGYVATILSESKNSSLKSGGQKEKMGKYNMSDQCNMMMSWETKLDAAALAECIACLSLKNFMERPWLNFVEDAFDEAVRDCQKKVKSVEGAQLFVTVTGCYRQLQ